MLIESAELHGPLPVAPGPGASMLSFSHHAAQPIPARSSTTTITTAVTTCHLFMAAGSCRSRLTHSVRRVSKGFALGVAPTRTPQAASDLPTSGEVKVGPPHKRGGQVGGYWVRFAARTAR